MAKRRPEPLAPPLPGGERSTREARRVRGQWPIESHSPPHPNPLSAGERECAEFAALSLHMRQEPIGDVVDAKLPVIDLAVLGSALLGGKNLQILLLRAAAFVQRHGLRQRHYDI